MSTDTPRTNAVKFWGRDMGNDSGPPHEECVYAEDMEKLERENGELRGKLERMAALADQLAQRNSPNWTVEAEARDNADDIRAILNEGQAK